MNPSEPPPKQDGRKRKERTPAQIEAYKRMAEARKNKSLINLNAPATAQSVAIADVWYSNHELAKEKRRKQKMEDVERVISTRLDQYHAKILDELQKPVSSFLENFLLGDDDDDEEEETAAATSSSKKQTTVNNNKSEPPDNNAFYPPLSAAAAPSPQQQQRNNAALLSSTRKRRTRFF
jgi:hypothetical protein